MMTTGELLSMMCDLDLCGIEWSKNTLDDKVNTIIQKVFLSND